MPIYEYACGNCKHTLDALQKMNDDPLRDCPECGEAKLKRLISAPRFRLKGSGWYETDFKKDNQRNVLKSDNDGATSDNKANAESNSKSEGSSTPASSSKSDSKDKKETKSDSTSKASSGGDKKSAAKASGD